MNGFRMMEIWFTILFRLGLIIFIMTTTYRMLITFIWASPPDDQHRAIHQYISKIQRHHCNATAYLQTDYKYSPTGQYLAVADSEGYIQVYSKKDAKSYAKISEFRAYFLYHVETRVLFGVSLGLIQGTATWSVLEAFGTKWPFSRNQPTPGNK